MKKSVLYFLLIAGFLIIGSMHKALIAQSTYESAQSGNYSDGSTWVGGQAPPNSQHILIKSGHTVTLDRGTDWNDYILVWDVTIEEGAVLNNNGWPLWIRTTTTSTPQYKNDGTHNGPGTMQAYENGDMRIDGNGSTNLDIEYHLLGALQVRWSSNLTINGDIKPTQYSYSGPTSAQQRIKYEIFSGVGGTLTVNGDVYSAGNIVSNNPVSVTIPAEGTLIVNGNIYFNAAADVIFNDGTFIATGDLILGTTTSSYFWNRNSGHAEIGGDVLGGGSSWLRISQGSYTKFGGQVFPVGFGGSFLIFQATDANTIEYAGTSDQTLLGSTAYRNLIISNSNATASIQSNVTVGTSLTIKPGAALSHSSGTFTVNGSFTIESDASATGSFISNNAYTGNVERHIVGHNNSGLDNGWHLLSAPVAAQAISGFHTAGSGNDFYKWSDTDGLWINRTTGDNTLNPDFEVNFGIGAGYLIANIDTDTKTFSGSINNSNVPISGLTSTNGGWHLLGNPFSSAVKWNDGNWALNNVDAIAQVWNAATASYLPIESNEMIPSMNGFFVRASQAGASLTIPAAARSHSSVNWYKGSDLADRIVLTAIDPEGQTAQSTIIRYNPNATSGYDNDYDSYFLAGFAPLFYSQSNEEDYALNTLPEIKEGQPIPLGFQKNNSNAFIIELTENSTSYEVYLTDRKLNIVHKLTAAPYTFTSSENDDPNRFLLNMGSVGINEMLSESGLKAWYANGRLNVINSGQGKIMIVDLLGRVVFSHHVDNTELYSVSLNLNRGVYLLVHTGKTRSQTTKINIQ